MRREQRRLYRDGKLLPLGSRAFDILQILVTRAGEVVSHEELIAAVWPNTFVAENNLRVNMTALRKVLGPEGSATNGMIANVPGRGYSFTATVAHQTIEPAPAGRGQIGGLRPLPKPLGLCLDARPHSPRLPDRSRSAARYNHRGRRHWEDHRGFSCLRSSETRLSRWRHLCRSCSDW
ncbi:winged helix-turn-helix domain-containing protein [Mesorhizobium sp. M8A.F.Ca.ET.057.01.1.1]|uniref:winged helix-turn-helix domain-containing protein n=1 Tax=Mesorhizobium sp. M8A.F.Ca.ET.057.01.1.1 TaxID=2493679 RepID=UPI001FDED961|nr:transcriptional regulator [Mesorhizobium sp. M8A.F.Ca.ET.057.01.1.1]